MVARRRLTAAEVFAVLSGADPRTAEAIRAQLATLDLADSSIIIGTDQTGQLRYNGRKEHEAIRRSRIRRHRFRRTSRATAAALDKISGAGLIRGRQQQARIQFLAAIVEQLLVDNKRSRDTEAAAMKCAWRRCEMAAPRPPRWSPAWRTICARGASRSPRNAMAPQPRLALIATVAASHYVPAHHVRARVLAARLFALHRLRRTILIVWHGIKMMLSGDSLGDHLFGFAKLLLFIAFGYALVAYYESPIPGVGVSFSNLITDQAHDFANILDARSLELVFDHLRSVVAGLCAA